MSPVPRTVPECAQDFHTLPFHPPELEELAGSKEQTARAPIQALPCGLPISCMILGKLLNLSLPLWSNGNKKSIYFMEWL